MQEKMGKNLVYVHEDGINYNLIKNDIIVGSCLQKAADVDTCVIFTPATYLFTAGTMPVGCGSCSR